MKVIFYGFVLIFAVLGLTDFIHFIVRKMLIERKETKNAKIVILKENTATCTLRFYLFENNWYGKTYSDKIIAITDGLSNETIDKCFETVAGSGIILIPKELLCDVLSTVF